MSDGMAQPCTCATAQDPQAVSNPPGLAEISYRADDFTGFRRALLRPLPGEQAIGTWRPAPGDLGLQVLEWWAYLGDVLTFYNERIATESYLRTATRPGSVANLVALLGYEPAPGIAATGNVAAIRSAGRPAEPLVIPAGLRLSSVATPGVPSQSFEADPAATFPGPSDVPVTLLPASPGSTLQLTLGDSGTPLAVLLAGRVGGVKPGDQLVLASSTFAGADDSWSLVTVGALAPAPDPGTGAVNTLVTFSAGGWGPAGAATTPASAGSAGYRLLRPTATTALWNQGTPAVGGPVVSFPEGAGPASPVTLTVNLSAAVRAISPGDLVLFDGGAGFPSALGVVANSSEVFWSVSYPTVSGSTPPSPPFIVIPHTQLVLSTLERDAQVLPDTDDQTTIAVRYGFKDVGTIIAVPVAALPSLPATVAVPASYPPPPAASTAFLQDATGAGVLVTVSDAGPGQVTLTGAGTPPSAITAPLQVPLRLLLDVVPVSRGTTVTDEVLGSGNAALINQSFTLAKSPLTYLASGAGAVAALVVRVDGVAWQQVPSFFGQAASARVFVVSRSADQTVTTVTFGDGVNGARLTSGTGNVVATYRYGSGAASPPAGRLTAISQPQPNLASIANPVAVSGGADPQAIEDVRADAPASVFTFGRAISAIDYEIVAAGAPGITRAAAYWAFDSAEQRTLVLIYVGGDQAVTAASAALAGAEDPNRPVSVLDATPVELQLSGTLVVAADQEVATVVAAATAAISGSAGGLFSPASMDIGQRLYRSAVDAALMVPGVTAVHDLTVSQPGTGGGQLFLDEFLDPGQGSFFDLPADNITIVGVSAGA
jgi:predicted phage baseplate assembly protein